MVTIIRKGSDKKEIEKAFSGLNNAKKFDAYKYCGIIELEEPLQLQITMRNEWE